MVLSFPQKLWAARKLILTAHNNRKSKPKGQGKTISYERKERQLSCVSTTKQAAFPASEILSHPKYQQEVLRIFPTPILIVYRYATKIFYCCQLWIIKYQGNRLRNAITTGKVAIKQY